MGRREVGREGGQANSEEGRRVGGSKEREEGGVRGWWGGREGEGGWYYARQAESVSGGREG